MTKYLEDSFTVAPGQSQAYRDGWDRIFGGKTPEQCADEYLPEDRRGGQYIGPIRHEVLYCESPNPHWRALQRVRNTNGGCDVDSEVQAAMDAGLVQRVGCGFAAALILTEAGQAVLESRE